MKLYKWDKHRWECQTAKEFFDHVLEDSIIRAWVKDRSVMFNRLFMKGNWEQFSEEELAQKLVDQKILKIEEITNVR